jgi:hypothetical protein
MQVPALPVIAQDLQVPVQAVAQQTPWAQVPELQSALAPQLAPMGFNPQLPDTQKLPVAQSVSPEQVVLHWPEEPQMKGAQDWLAGEAQVPLPSQRPAKVSAPPVQPALWQATPAGYFSQAPAPSQVPSVPQLDLPVSVQPCRGFVPRSAGIQLPAVPSPLQETQAPVQAVSQQTPSTQKPDLHAAVAVAVQGWPLSSIGEAGRSTGRSTPESCITVTGASAFASGLGELPPSTLRICAPPPHPTSARTHTPKAAATRARTLGWGRAVVMRASLKKNCATEGGILGRCRPMQDFVSRRAQVILRAPRS